eukprot:jgi/Tetstr1/457215/TSEL_043863.t1
MDYVYGYVIENVIPAAPSRRSPEMQEFIDFMARVFGEPNAHHAHKCGDASLRSALWWTNTFTQHYYQAVQHEFERPPRETYAQIVERCSAVMREACLLDRDYVGFYTRQELGFSEEEMAIAIGNVFEDHSVNTQELRAAQHELRRSTAAAVEAEMEHVINMATLKQGTRPFWAPLASVRVLALGAGRRPAGVGSRAGAGLMADVFRGAQERPAWAKSHVNDADDKAAADGWSRRSQAALVKCYAAYANEKHLGKESPTVKVTSKLINPKDSKQPHHWTISEDWKDKEGFAALMDSDPEWYAWGLDDLRAVDAEPYDFQLVDYNPIFKRQYHLAPREQEWANDWVRKLEKAGIVGEIESPYAAPVIVAPKKDEHGAWTDLRYAVYYRGLNERTIRDQYPCPTADELMTRMEGASRFTATDCTKAFISAECVEPMADKVQAINPLPAPKNVSDVRHFLGMATYYCRFLESFSLVKAPLTTSTKKDTPWKWGAAEQQSFDAIKAMLVSAPVMRHPDWRRPFVLHTDWSRVGEGACLPQVDDNGVEYAVSFASRMNTPVEADLSSYEGEVGAVVWAVQRFRYYLYGNHFQLITDCKAMEWLRTTARLRGKLARWSLILAEYDFSIKHRPGKDNTVPDSVGVQCQRSHPVAISYLRGETTPADVPVEVWQQLVRRCAKYNWHNDKVWLHTGDTAREVPKPEERPDAIRRVHASIGHLGRDRTYQVLARHFVWPGMHKDVGAMVNPCRACDRVKASFNQKHDRLKPMPLFGLFYRFSVDSAGPLPTSSEGHKYVIVIVEHFSKWIEPVPVRDLEASTTAKAFHERVLARY